MNGHDMAHEPAAVHGMLIVGEAKIYLSHLPMFHSPHDYQVLLEVSLHETGGDPERVYREDRRISGERVYTGAPKAFALPTLLAPPGRAAVMEGTIFRGHFERGGKPITSGQVTANVTRLCYGRKFTPAVDGPQFLTYLLFGSSVEPFVAHLISRPLDFDQVLSVASVQLPFDWDGRCWWTCMTGRTCWTGGCEKVKT